MSHTPFIISSKALKDHLDNFGCTGLGRSEAFAGIEQRGIGHGMSVSTPPNWRDEWFARLSSLPTECKLPRGFKERDCVRKAWAHERARYKRDRSMFGRLQIGR